MVILSNLNAQLVFNRFCTLFSHCFYIWTNSAFRNKIVAYLDCAFVDTNVTNHTRHDVTLDGTLIRQVVFICVSACAVLEHLACLNTFATTRIVEHHEFRAVAERVLIYLLHFASFLLRHFPLWHILKVVMRISSVSQHTLSLISFSVLQWYTDFGSLSP